MGIFLRKKESYLQSIGSAIFWNGLLKGANFFKQIVLAAAMGLSAELDVFYMSIAILGLLVFSWGNVLDVIMIPKLIKIKENSSSDFKQYVASIFWRVVGFTFILVYLLYFFSSYIPEIAIGFDEGRSDLLGQSFYWFLPGVLFYLPAKFLGSVLRSVRDFSGYYQSEFIMGIVILTTILFFPNYKYVLSWSFSIGAFFCFIYLVYRCNEFVCWNHISLKNDIFNAFEGVVALILLAVVQYSYTFVDRIFVSFLPLGSVSALSYANNLVIFASALIQLTGGFLTILGEQKSVLERVTIVNNLVTFVILISSVICVLFVTSGYELIGLLFERGAFTEEDTELTYLAVLGYLGIVLPVFLIGPLDQVFLVEKKIYLVIFRVLIGLFSNILFNYLFIFVFDLGVFGVAIATSISFLLVMISMFFGLHSIGYKAEYIRHLKWIVWLLLPILFSFFMSKFLGNFFNDIYYLIVSFFIVCFSVFLFVVSYPGEEKKLIIDVFVSRVFSKIYKTFN